MLQERGAGRMRPPRAAVLQLSAGAVRDASEVQRRLGKNVREKVEILVRELEVHVVHPLDVEGQRVASEHAHNVEQVDRRACGHLVHAHLDFRVHVHHLECVICIQRGFAVPAQIVLQIISERSHIHLVEGGIDIRARIEHNRVSNERLVRTTR